MKLREKANARLGIALLQYIYPQEVLVGISGDTVAHPANVVLYDRRGRGFYGYKRGGELEVLLRNNEPIPITPRTVRIVGWDRCCGPGVICWTCGFKKGVAGKGGWIGIGSNEHWPEAPICAECGRPLPVIIDPKAPPEIN